MGEKIKIFHKLDLKHVQIGRDCFNLFGLDSNHYSNKPNLEDFIKTYNASDVVDVSNAH